MFRIVTHAIRLTFILLLVCGLFGCATFPTAHRYYSGPPLPNDKIALIFTISTYSTTTLATHGCQMNNIRGESEKEAKKLGIGPSKMIEVLPGQYLANILLLYDVVGDEKYDSIEELKLKKYKKYDSIEELKLNVQAGNIYVIYPEIEGKGPKTTFKEFMWGKALGSKWRPKVVNINDYSDEECSDSRYELRCPGKDIIRKMAARYLESERSTISYHPSNVFVVNVDGVSRQLDSGDVWE